MKKINRITVILVFVILALVSCKSSTRLTNLDRGLFDIENLDADLAKSIIGSNVKVIPLAKQAPPKKEKAKNFFSLNDSTQVTYLKILGGMVGNNPDKLIKYMKVDLSDPAKSSSKISKTDYSKFNVRIHLSTIKDYAEYDKEMMKKRDENEEGFSYSRRYHTMLHPNTRLSYLNTRIELVDNDIIEFLTIDKLENEFELIDLGSLEREQEVTFNSKVSAEYGGGTTTDSKRTTSLDRSNPKDTTVINKYDENGNLIESQTSDDRTSSGNRSSENNKSRNINTGASGEVSFTNRDAIKEALNIKANRLKSGFSFNTSQITLTQRAGNLREIADNVIITATLQVKDDKLEPADIYSFRNLFGDKGANPISKVKIDRRTIKYIPCKDFISSNIKLASNVNGVIRKVRNQRRGRSNYEFDDKVTYHLFKYNDSITSIINLSEYCVKPLNVKIKIAGLANKLTLKTEYPTTQDITLLSSDNPNLLIAWLNRQFEYIRNTPLKEIDNSRFVHPVYKIFIKYPKGTKTYLINDKPPTDGDLMNLKKVIEAETSDIEPETSNE